MSIGMFVVGFLLFSIYLVGLVTMIMKAHKQQRRELENDPELQDFDWDAYHQSRGKLYKKKSTKKKKNVGKKMYWD